MSGSGRPRPLRGPPNRYAVQTGRKPNPRLGRSPLHIPRWSEATASLEVQLQGELDDAVAALQDDLAEVLQRLRREREALGRIADVVHRAADAVGNAVHAHVALR